MTNSRRSRRRLQPGRGTPRCSYPCAVERGKSSLVLHPPLWNRFPIFWLAFRTMCERYFHPGGGGQAALFFGAAVGGWIVFANLQHLAIVRESIEQRAGIRSLAGVGKPAIVLTFLCHFWGLPPKWNAPGKTVASRRALDGDGSCCQIRLHTK